MAKTHLKAFGADYRDQGQTEYDYNHQSACGYVRANVTSNADNVDCKYCLNSLPMVYYHAIKKSFCDSKG